MGTVLPDSIHQRKTLRQERLSRSIYVDQSKPFSATWLLDEPLVVLPAMALNWADVTNQHQTLQPISY